MYPFPDQMLLMMDAALDRGRFESSATDDRSAWDRGYTILSTEELRNGIDLQQVAAMQRRYR